MKKTKVLLSTNLPILLCVCKAHFFLVPFFEAAVLACFPAGTLEAGASCKYSKHDDQDRAIKTTHSPSNSNFEVAVFWWHSISGPYILHLFPESNGYSCQIIEYDTTRLMSFDHVEPKIYSTEVETLRENKTHLPLAG